MSTNVAFSSENKFMTAILGSSDMVVEGAKKTHMKIMTWLFGCVTWVFKKVILGGITCLTRSGLSMTYWKLIGNSLLTMIDRWEVEFDKYKQ